MKISTRTLSTVIAAAALIVAAVAPNASAQYRPSSSEAVGEDYHIEVAYGWWNPEPSLIVNSAALGILGDDVNLISDLGIEQKRLGKFDLVLRPAKKHRFRFQYLPISYQVEAQVRRSFIFNGQRYNLGLPVLEYYSGSHSVGRCLMDGFPYAVIYVCRPDEIVVVAVAHTRRRPLYWLDRLR